MTQPHAGRYRCPRIGCPNRMSVKEPRVCSRECAQILAEYPYRKPQDLTWWTRARCQGADERLLFGYGHEQYEGIIALCQQCPVIDACRAEAILADTLLYGVWGGLTIGTVERIRQRRATRSQAEAAR